MTTKKATKINPEEYARRMRAIQEKSGYDPERDHAKADDLLEETLVSLGYEVGIESYREIGKWYA